MKRCLVFDTGPVISLTTNNLLWLLNPLKRQFNGEFYISKRVSEELVENPLTTKKYKFEALQVLRHITDNTMTIVEKKEVDILAKKLMDYANRSFKAYGNYISVLHYGEIQSLALAVHLNAEAFVVDERTIRKIIENPADLVKILTHKLHTKITVDQKNFRKFSEIAKRIKLIRSFELATIAFELGLLDKYITEEERKKYPNLSRSLLEGVLWGVKLNGCAVTEREINQILKLES